MQDVILEVRKAIVKKVAYIFPNGGGRGPQPIKYFGLAKNKCV